MKTIGKIDFDRLVGFAAASEHLGRGVDFKDTTVGATLGAKVGVEPGVSGDAPALTVAGARSSNEAE